MTQSKTTLDDVMHIMENHAAVHKGGALDALRLLSVGNRKMRDQYVKVLMEQWEHMMGGLSESAIRFMGQLGNVAKLKENVGNMLRRAHLHPKQPENPEYKVYRIRNYEGWPVIHIFIGNNRYPRIVVQLYGDQMEAVFYVTFAKRIPISVSCKILFCPDKNFVKSGPSMQNPNDLYMELQLKLQPISINEQGVHVEWVNTRVRPHLPKHIGVILADDSRLMSAMLKPILWAFRRIREELKSLDVQNSSASLDVQNSSVSLQTQQIQWNTEQEATFIKNNQRNLERLQEVLQFV